jgi:hypothetical protein
MGRQEGRQMGRQDAPLGAPLLCSKRGVSPKGPPMIDCGRLDMVVTRTLQLDLDALPIRDRAALRRPIARNRYIRRVRRDRYRPRWSGPG